MQIATCEHYNDAVLLAEAIDTHTADAIADTMRVVELAEGTITKLLLTIDELQKTGGYTNAFNRNSIAEAYETEAAIAKLKEKETKNA